jgi:hypothetical protein
MIIILTLSCIQKHLILCSLYASICDFHDSDSVCFYMQEMPSESNVEDMEDYGEGVRMAVCYSLFHAVL